MNATCVSYPVSYLLLPASLFFYCSHRCIFDYSVLPLHVHCLKTFQRHTFCQYSLYKVKEKINTVLLDVNVYKPSINLIFSWGSFGLVPREPQEKQCDAISSSENKASIKANEYFIGFIARIPNRLTPVSCIKANSKAPWVKSCCYVAIWPALIRCYKYNTCIMHLHLSLWASAL